MSTGETFTPAALRAHYFSQSVLSPPKTLLLLYFLILFTWSYLGKSSIILLCLGCAFGYVVCINATQSQHNKSALNMQLRVDELQKTSLSHVAKSLGTELAISPRVDDSLNKLFDLIIRDFVLHFYDPINPNKNPEFEIQIRKAMNAMAMNLTTFFRKLDKVDWGIMTSFAVSNTFIVHLREYRKYVASKQSLEKYCKINETSPFVHTTSRAFQAKSLRALSFHMFSRLLPKNEAESAILTSFFSELFANEVLGKTLDTICDSDWINCMIVDYLINEDPSEEHTTIFEQLAFSINEEVAGLAKQFQSPVESTTDLKTIRMETESGPGDQEYIITPIDRSTEKPFPEIMQKMIHEQSNFFNLSGNDELSESYKARESLRIEINKNAISFESDISDNCDGSEEALFEDALSEVKDFVLSDAEPTPATNVLDFCSDPPSSPSRAFIRSDKSVQLQKILQHQYYFGEFMAFLEDFGVASFLRFWLQADSFHKISSNEENHDVVQEDAMRIFDSYFGENAANQIKMVPRDLVTRCYQEIMEAPTGSCFMTIQEYVFGLLERDYFDSFIKAMHDQDQDLSSLNIYRDSNNSSVASSPSSLSPSISNSFLSQDRDHDTSTLSSISSQPHSDEEQRLSNTVDNTSITTSSNNIESHSDIFDIPDSQQSVGRPRIGSRSNNTLQTPDTFLESQKATNQNISQNGITDQTLKAEEIQTTEEQLCCNDDDEPKLAMNLMGVRIKMSDVSEATPKKLILSTKSLQYMIEVERPGSTGWIMTRSFNDFETMHAALVEEFPKADKVVMPRLVFRKNQEACIALERYLNILLSDNTLCQSQPLQRFMKRDGIPKHESPTEPLTQKKNILWNSKKFSLKTPPNVNLATNRTILNGSRQNYAREAMSPRPSLDTVSNFFPKRIRTSLESWGSSATVASTTDINEEDSSNSNTTTPITDKPLAGMILQDKLTFSEPSPLSPNIKRSNPLSPNIKRSSPLSPNSIRSKPNKQLTDEDINLLIDTVFGLVEEIFDLSEKSQWHLRRTVLSLLREVVRRSFSQAIKGSFVTTVESYFSEDQAISSIDKLTNSFWPNGDWAGPASTRTEQEILKTREEAKKLLLQKMVPNSLRQVMGNENSRVMIETLVDGFLAEKEVVRGMGVSIMESVVRLVLAE